MTFKPAVKLDAKLRLALCGPAGSGKTYSLLSIASELGGPIAYVDTEHGSASKYADLFSFDVIEPDVYDPRELIKLIVTASQTGYKVIGIDSLSHYWMGKGGELEMVDGAAKRTQGNSFAAWKHVTPVHNELIDTIIGSPIHVLVSMRTKTEWVIEQVNGKSAPRKVGLAPVMRDGIEFSFDICGDLDQENTLTVTKSRCPALTGKIVNRPGKDMAQTLKQWLTGAAPAVAASVQAPAATQPFQATDDDIPTVMGGTYEPPPNPAPERIERMRQGNAQAQQPVAQADKPWTTFKQMIEAFGRMKERVGDTIYYGELDLFNVKHANQIKDSATAIACYAALMGRVDARDRQRGAA